MTSAALLDGTDRAIFAASFVARLKRAGLPVSIHSGERFAAAIAQAPPPTRTELYWLSRISLVQDVRSLELFDQVFEVIFEGGALPIGRSARKGGKNQPRSLSDSQIKLASRNQVAEGSGGVPWTSAPSAAPHDSNEEEPSEIELPELLPSALADFADQPFDQLNDSELAQLGEWLEQAQIRWPTRPARRARRVHRGSELDRRRTLAAARRTGGDPIQLHWKRSVRRPRKVVMLADVSGSMQTFARPYMHVMRALTSQVQAEVFAFSTDLTRITPALREQRPEDAIDAASELVDDRFSGTKIAGSLRTLLSNPTWSTSVRGAVILVTSDGWDTDDPEDLSMVMARLQRLSHRIVWVNPRAAAEEFEPLVGGMAAALPHCDAMLSGHSLRAMRDVILELGRSKTQPS